MKYARLVGVSEAEFNAAMRERPMLEAIVEERQKATEDWNVSSTPSFVVNNDKLLSNMNYEHLLLNSAPMAFSLRKIGRHHDFRSLKMAGFKSFADTADVDIEAGLTGIVGPNGCGKSNVVEGLRWVMGEALPAGCVALN